MVAADPHTSATVYLTVQGFSGFSDTMGHVFRSNNGGTNWIDISSNLPNIGVNDILVDPDIAGRLYVATDIGVFYTSNYGGNWATVVSGLPRVEVESLRLQRATRTLRAATYGRSAWDLAVPLPPGTVTLAPASLTFPRLLVGMTSASMTVTLRNTGAVAVTFTSVVGSGDFAITAKTCGARLASGSSCTVSVAFHPTAIGTRNGMLTLTDSASGNPQKISLTGTGTRVTLSTVSLAFGVIKVGASSPTKTVTVKNTGTSTLTITSVTISGDFRIAKKSCGASLAAGSSCMVAVYLHPTTTGARIGTLSVYDNGGGSPQKVALSGTGS